MDYTRNEDKLVCSESLGACYNTILSIGDDFGSGPVTEPVSLAEIKSYLRLEGFTDQSGATENDYDDALLEEMITEARSWVEKFTGVLVVPREITVTFLNQAGYIQLPGPVTGTIVLNDNNDTVIDSNNYDFIGTDFKTLETVYQNRATAVYTAGYDEAPKWVKNAIRAYVAWAYENRGDVAAGSPERAASICRAYKRIQWVA